MPSAKFINLRAKPFNDADLLIEGLSKQGEKLSLTAKNALLSKKRFGGGVLEPLNFVEFYYTQARSGYLYIQEAKVLYGFAGLRQDYRRLEFAFHLVKLISQATFEGLQDGSVLFDLLGNSLKSLETAKDMNLLKLHFELKYLFYLGVLELSDDTAEFIAKPVSLHNQIRLTDDEFSFLQQRANHGLRSFHASHQAMMAD